MPKNNVPTAEDIDPITVNDRGIRVFERAEFNERAFPWEGIPISGHKEQPATISVRPGDSVATVKAAVTKFAEQSTRVGFQIDK